MPSTPVANTTPSDSDSIVWMSAAAIILIVLGFPAFIYFKESQRNDLKLHARDDLVLQLRQADVEVGKAETHHIHVWLSVKCPDVSVPVQYTWHTDAQDHKTATAQLVLGGAGYVISDPQQFFRFYPQCHVP